MKRTLLPVLLASLWLGACSTTPKPTVTAADAASDGVRSAPATAGAVSATDVEARKLAEQREALAKKSVYFAFDDFTVAEKYRDVIRQQADFTLAHGTDTVAVEGNADERGSREYNLALGQKRAEAVRKSLVLLGVPDARLEAVSFGAEKPRESCHEEHCWAENRRVDFNHRDK
ncbi:MAG TPA: peptidoglycan-associated lipoprotein Pal [Rhodocyclaceae bacterium]|nr:peptidoglycan-associated lipoprotein Pal [Rhodocyclaceae bacterium]